MFLTDLTGVWNERLRLAGRRADFLDEAGVFLDATPHAAAEWTDRTPLMHEGRRDGIAI